MEKYNRNNLGRFTTGKRSNLSLEHKDKISKAHKGKKEIWQQGEKHYYWKGGKPKCVNCGKQLIKYKAKLCKICAIKKRWIDIKNGTVKNKMFETIKKIGILGIVSQYKSKKLTSIEKKLYSYLENKKIIFEKQYLVNNRFLVDAYIPSKNLIIEADGDYWHGLDRVKKKDKAENAYLTKCGYKLLRLPEHGINDGSFCRKVGELI